MDKQYVNEEELQQLHSIQERQNKIVEELGLLEIQKIKLRQRREELEYELEDFQEESQTLIDFISKKYGDCSIDLNTGEITQ
jgi:uncharacterized protein YpmB